MAVIAKVAVQAATYAIDKAYDYLLPEEVGGQAGCRVLVPFGRGNRLTEAMILSLHQAVPDKPLKAVRSLLDEEPVITERELRLALWMTRRYFCTFYDALRTVLPAAVWYHYRETWSLAQPPLVPTRQEAAVCRLLQDGPLTTDKLRQALGDDVEPLLRRMAKSGALHCKKEQSRKVRDKVVLFARLAVPVEEALALAGKSQRRREAVTFLAQNGETALHDVTYFTGVSRQTLNALEKLGAVAYREQEEYRISEKQYTVKAEELTLNDQQQHVCDTLLAQVRTETPGVTLLRGVTGSGKTVVYIRLAQELLKMGRSVMILVPEIALTPQMMARFTAYFGHEVALLHSGLRMTERYDQFKRLRRGEAHIVLGTRSAVFAPLENLGLIIMDEEQEGSYQSENAPCYHARDVAKYRCAAEGARLLLGSATPTVETFYHAQQGEYDLLELTERYNRRALPEVRIADLRQELRAGNSTVISRPLQEELAKNIAAGEQSILFLNRRGSSRQLLCPQCGYVPECPRCSVYLTYHSANDRLMCHYCGYSHAAPTVCPECGGTLKHIGFGTQRVEEELHELFPGVEVLRMDADTVSVGHEALLKEFEERQIPILLGTQMVAKGLDMPNVTLVGVLDADLSLFTGGFRAGETTFDMLTQVVGRAGRGSFAGQAILQTMVPNHELIQLAARQDYDRFYDLEIRLRQVQHVPPFADQVLIAFQGLQEPQVLMGAVKFRDSLLQLQRSGNFGPMELLGPAPSPVPKINYQFRYRLTLRCRLEKNIRAALSYLLSAFGKDSKMRGVNAFIDVNGFEG